MSRIAFRQWTLRNLHCLVFLGAYFFSTVAGNLVYASPLAGESLAASGMSSRFLSFPTTFSAGYWVLLLCPFVVTPIIVLLTKRLFGERTTAIAEALPDFRPAEYAVLALVCFGYVVYRFWAVHVGTLFASGVTAESSVEARFLIRERLGFLTLVPLQAILPYLTIYAFIGWMHSRRLVWLLFAVGEFLILSVLLVMLNMKWPVLLFYVALVVTIFAFSKRYAYLKTAAGTVFIFLAFLVISTFVFRLVPPPAPAAPAATAASAATKTAPAGSAASKAPVAGRAGGAANTLSHVSERVVATTQATRRNTSTILLVALNRMAIAYPYYYQVFTEQGPICGGILAQARRHPVCRPSTMIYSEIFPSHVYGTDDFESGGTAPLGMHISGYAIGGWPVAMLALVAGSVILGLFSALPIGRTAATDSLVILGAITAYHFSQIPGEGVIFYEHGLLWTLLVICGYSVWRRLTDRPLAHVFKQSGAH